MGSVGIWRAGNRESPWPALDTRILTELDAVLQEWIIPTLERQFLAERDRCVAEEQNF
jgi:hypothetical protein